MALSNKFVKEGFLSALSEGLGGLILGGGYMGYNMYQNYKGFKNMPGNVGYDVNGTTYREDGSVTNAFDLVGTGADTQHAFLGKNIDDIEVYETSNSVKSLTNKDRINQFEDIIANDIGRTARFEKNGHVFYARFTPVDVSKNIYGDKKSSIKGWKAKIKSGADGDIFNIAENMKYDHGGAERGKSSKIHKITKGWDYFVKTVQIDGNVFDVVANIRKGPDGEFIYILEFKNNKNIKASPPIGSNPTTVKTGAQRFSNISVPQSAAPVNSYNMQNQNNNSGSSTQKAMPVLNSNAEAGVGADNIIAPADKIAQIPTANRKMLNVWSKRTGAKILIADTGAKFGQESAGAYSRSKDTIVIDWKTATNSDAFARKILTHEGVHSVETSEFYNELRDYAFKNLYASEDAKKKAVTDKINEYGKEGVTLDDVGAEKELVADYLSEHILSSEKAINSFCRQNPSLAKNVYWSLKKAYAYLTDEEKFEEIKNIEKGLAIFEKALNTRTMGETDGGVQYMFAGEKAKGADLSQLAEAQRLFAEGKTSKEEIWKQTGWMKGIDNKWRFEIDDSKAQFYKLGKFENPGINRFKALERKFILETITNSELVELNGLKESLKGVRTQPKYLYEFLEHDDLYKNYPGLKNIEVEFVEMKGGLRGEFDAYNNKIRVNKKLTGAQAKSTLIHEVQHAVQSIEEFEGGTDSERALEYVRRLMADELNNSNDEEFYNAKTYQEIYKVIDDRLVGVYNQLYGNVHNIDDVAQLAYENFYGEIEARETVHRMNDLDENQKKSEFPLNVDKNKTPPFTHKEYQNENLQKNKNQNSSQDIYNAFQVENKEVGQEGNNPKQKVGQLAGNIQFSSPVASADTKISAEAESDVKIKSNKAKNYYDRYVRTAKRDFGKLLSIPRSRLGVIDGNIDTLAGEYFYTGKISESSKEALFEKAWSEGIIIDDTNKDFAKALRKDLKSSTLYISPEDAKDIPDFGVWSRSQIGNIKSRMIARATILQ